MSESFQFLRGEFRRRLDERFRLSLPAELVDPLLGHGPSLVLAKEQPGALSLWSAARSNEQLRGNLELIEAKMRGDRLFDRLEEVQTLGRLLSTRQAEIKLRGRGRLLVPEGFREFLGVEPGSDVIVVGAGLCLELWNPESWFAYLKQEMPNFRRLLGELSS